MLKSLPMRLAGWKFETPPPAAKKCVVLAWPHTTNWDGFLMLAIAQDLGLKMSWMIKDDWIKGPMGRLLRHLGAVPVNRAGAHNLVDQMVEAFRAHDELMLIIPPEGTRGRADYWKSGFYHIARGANVPVVPGYMDYRRKRAGMGAPIHLTGDVKADMDAIRAAYAALAPHGHVPANVGPIRLRDEAGAGTSPGAPATK
jgi:1-acyl-sn-glycerol-3-phosphate acyltransferase